MALPQFITLPRRRIVILAFVVIAGLCALWLPLSTWLQEFLRWQQDAGFAGILAFAAFYVIGGIAMVPGTLLTLGAGFTYGPLLGVLIVSPASVAAATLSFLLGRTLLRGWVEQRLTQHPRFGVVDEAVRTSGIKVIVLLRLSPLFPFSVLNYGLGLTQIRLRDYILGSFLGMLPATCLYVYLGSLITNVHALLHADTPSAARLGQAFYWIGFAATLLVVLLLTRLARQALAKTISAD